MHIARAGGEEGFVARVQNRDQHGDLFNGDARSLLLFGGLMAYGLLHIGVGLAQGSRPSPEVRKGHDLLSLVMGAAFYAAMTQLHPVLIGVPVLSL